MPCHGWGITTTMHDAQGEAAERARAADLGLQVLQQEGQLAALRAQLQEALQQRQAAAPKKVRAPLLCLPTMSRVYGLGFALCPPRAHVSTAEAAQRQALLL